jgi:sortase family protein
MPSRNRTRRVVPLLLAVVLAAEVGAMAIATRAAAHAGVATDPSTAAAAAEPPTRLSGPVARVEPGSAAAVQRARAAAGSIAETTSAVAATFLPRSRPSIGRAAVARPELEASPRAATQETRTAAAYRGRNHVWIPALGIDRSVSAFPCSRSRPPDNYVYRWGCAGRNNVYLLGHAHGVFKRLHDAYVSGRLRKGLEVFYADGAGRVTRYVVAWWRTTRPTTSAAWAWAPQTRPSMTIQTCVGSNSEFRLMVRLVAAG